MQCLPSLGPSRRKCFAFLLILLVAGFVLGECKQLAAAETPAKPNIIFILADDKSY